MIYLQLLLKLYQKTHWNETCQIEITSKMNGHGHTLEK